MSALSLPFSDSIPSTAPRPGSAGSLLTPTDPDVATAAALVRRLAATPDLWRHLLRFGEGDERWYARLDVDLHHEVWLISWLPGQSTGLHDHGEALGAFAVAEGALTETAVRPHRRGSVVDINRREFAPGEVRGFGYEHIHEVGNRGTVPAVSLHAYAPELTAMTQYVLEDRRLRVVASERLGGDW